MRAIAFVRSFLRHYRRRRQQRQIYQRFKSFTMVPVQTFAENLALAERVRSIDGCVVECGVWRGGMSAGIAAVLGPSRKYYLFDSFEGLPPAQDIDGSAALKWQRDQESPAYCENCSASPQFAKEALDRAGATDVELVRGWFKDTIPTHQFGQPIALLRLDGDWYESTMVCLENLFHHVAPGGLIILDDYYTWDGCSRALHDFLSSQSATERIQSVAGVCFLTKAA